MKILQNKTLQQLQLELELELELELAMAGSRAGRPTSASFFTRRREEEGLEAGLGTNKNHLVWPQPAGRV